LETAAFPNKIDLVVVHAADKNTNSFTIMGIF
jgi:hypothetical protein